MPWKKTSLGGIVLAFALTGCRTSVATADNLGQAITPAAMKAEKAALLAQCPPPLQLSEADASKLPIHVTRWGNSGPRVLIIHGGEQTMNALGGGPKNFAKQEVLGQQGWRLELPDRPGFGESPSRGPDDQLGDALWIAAMLDGGANLMGHSFGGAEALLAAARDPKAVLSLILIEPALWPLLQHDQQAYNSPVIQAERQLRDEDLMNAKTPADYASRFLSSFQPKKSGFKEFAARTVIKLIPGLSKKIGCGILNAREASSEQMREAAAVVALAHIPVLVITGGWSPSRDVLGNVVAKTTGGRHVIVKSPNHIIMSSNPIDFNSTVTAFMHDADRAQSRAD